MNPLSDHERPHILPMATSLGRLDRDVMLGIFKVERVAWKLSLDVRRHDVTLTGVKSVVDLYQEYFPINSFGDTPRGIDF